MATPVFYTNTVTIKDNYKGYFAVESDKIHPFIAALERIVEELSGKKPMPEKFNFNIGKTKFVGLKLSLEKQERMDIILTTNCDGTKITMHLSDAKISNANNVFFITTWLKYIKGSLK